MDLDFGPITSTQLLLFQVIDMLIPCKLELKNAV